MSDAEKFFKCPSDSTYWGKTLDYGVSTSYWFFAHDAVTYTGISMPSYYVLAPYWRMIVGRDEPGNAVQFDQLHPKLAKGTCTKDDHSECTGAHVQSVNILAIDGRVRIYVMNATDKKNSCSSSMVWGGLDETSHNYVNY